MSTDRLYDGFSVVSTGLKCTILASVQLRRVFSMAVSQHGPYLRSAQCERLASPSHLYLVIYTYDLGVRRLPFALGGGGLTVSFAHTTSSSHCVRVFDI